MNRSYLQLASLGAFAFALSTPASAVSCPVGCEHFGSQYDYFCEAFVSPQGDYTYYWEVGIGWQIMYANDGAMVAQCASGDGPCVGYGFSRKVTVYDGAQIVCTFGNV